MEAFGDAAVRHFTDAELLADASRIDGAGHLIGFAVECAIKHAIRSPAISAKIPHSHLPELIEKAKQSLKGRKHLPIYHVIEIPDLMLGWDIAHRYFTDGTISPKKFDDWRNHAKRTLGAAGLRRSLT